jgi:hypothetical protein
VTSFVRANVIPQPADAAEVLHGIDVPDGVSMSGLVPNERGLIDYARSKAPTSSESTELAVPPR